jgi:hypothetical protein
MATNAPEVSVIIPVTEALSNCPAVPKLGDTIHIVAVKSIGRYFAINLKSAGTISYRRNETNQ